MMCSMCRLPIRPAPRTASWTGRFMMISLLLVSIDCRHTTCLRSIKARGSTAVHSDRGPLNVARAIAGQEDGKLRDIFGLAQSTDALFCDCVVARLIRQDTRGFSSLFE